MRPCFTKPRGGNKSKRLAWEPKGKEPPAYLFPSFETRGKKKKRLVSRCSVPPPLPRCATRGPRGPSLRLPPSLLCFFSRGTTSCVENRPSDRTRRCRAVVAPKPLGERPWPRSEPRIGRYPLFASFHALSPHEPRVWVKVEGGSGSAISLFFSSPFHLAMHPVH